MNIFSRATWTLGAKSLTLHPLRSLLTILGIFIGIASVIWLLAIGEGISLRIQRQIEALGTNNIIIRSVKPVNEGTVENDSMAIYGITRDDYDVLVETIPTIKQALKIRDVERELRYGTKEMSVHMIGCTPEYASTTGLKMDHGTFLSSLDLKNKATVCVLSHELAKTLFPIDDPVDNKFLRIRNTPYKVIGVMQQRQATAAIGSSLAAQDFSDDVYVPITTFWQYIGDWTLIRGSGTRINEVVEISQITCQVDSLKQVVPTADAIRTIMNQRHPEGDFTIVTPLELLEQAKMIRLMFMLFMGMIAAISLLVGGIGIMNIMLATVTERTREIGIRRALGARKRDIIRQFLAETVVLSTVGGIAGIVGGMACPWVIVTARNVVTQVLPDLMSDLPEAVHDITPQIVPLSIPLAFGIAVAVGIVFGIYPAIRAASMDPIQALRHE